MLKEFECTYIDIHGVERTTFILAGNQREAVQRLKEQGFIVTEVKERVKKEFSFSLFLGINQQDLYNIANQLSILLRSGMKIDQALNLLTSTTKKPKLKEILSAINQEIKAGQGVASAFEKNKLFTSVCVSMIHVGETVGNLATAFDNVAQYLKFQIELKREIINALIYPFFLVLASFFTLIFMFNFIIPRFLAIFQTTGSIPITAKFVFTLSKVFNAKVFILLFIVGLLSYLLNRSRMVNFSPERISWFLTRLPFVWTLFFNLELSRFCYSMYSMLKGGVEFIKAVELSANIIQDKALRDTFLTSIREIKKGKRIAEVYSQMPILPDIFVNLVVVGDESGNLADIFLELYQVFNDNFKTAIKRFLTLLEPAIIIFMGLIVGFIIVSLILTVMNVGAIKF
jgi:general secretion pathway protein F